MQIVDTSDGSHTLVSEVYGVAYHSTHGAVTESEHVFIAAGLREKATAMRELSVLEVGFGTGLNAFMSLLEAERLGITLHYHALETRPISLNIARQLNHPHSLGVPQRSADFLSLHTSDWDVPHGQAPFFWHKHLLSVLELEAPESFDLIYFDAFAPSAQAELWEQEVFERLFRSLRHGGMLVTYCAQGEFRRRMKRAGFEVEKLPGPPGKREMTRGKKAGKEISPTD